MFKLSILYHDVWSFCKFYMYIPFAYLKVYPFLIAVLVDLMKDITFPLWTLCHISLDLQENRSGAISSMFSVAQIKIRDWNELHWQSIFGMYIIKAMNYNRLNLDLHIYTQVC